MSCAPGAHCSHGSLFSIFRTVPHGSNRHNPFSRPSITGWCLVFSSIASQPVARLKKEKKRKKKKEKKKEKGENVAGTGGNPRSLVDVSSFCSKLQGTLANVGRDSVKHFRSRHLSTLPGR